MSHPLEGLDLKRDLAIKEIDRLQKLIQWSGKPDLYSVSEEIETETGNYVVVADPLGHKPDPEWAVSLGHVLHDFRGMLDYLAWELTCKFSGPPPFPLDPAWERVQFPIFNNQGKYHSMARKYIWGINPQLWAMIEGEQPFPNSDREPLWTLYKLNNIDKHRRLNFLDFAVKLKRWTGPPGFSEISSAAAWKRFDKTTEVLRLDIGPDRPKSKVHVETRFEFDVLVNEPEVAPQPFRMLACLWDIFASVNNVVMTFRREFP